MNPADVVAEARSWIGTPFLHQGRVKGQGVDCKGHVAGVAVALGAVSESWCAKLDSRYPRVPKAVDSVLAILEGVMEYVDYAEPGDVLVMSFRSEAAHMGFMGEAYGQPTLIHALMGEGGKGVVEHRITERWKKRIVAAYRMH